jgi:hypothetical protein
MATATTSNSYIVKTDADTYFDERLHCSAWSAADSEDNERALIHATRILDGYIKWHKTPDKTDNDNIDQAIKDATCEMALVLLDGDMQVKDDMDGLSSVSLSGMSVAKNGEKKVIPAHVFRLISHLGQRRGYTGSLTIVRDF